MKTFYSKNLPPSTTIYEKILFAQFERLYFQRESAKLKQLTEIMSSKDFLTPLTEFKDINVLKKIEMDIKIVCLKLNEDFSFEQFYQIIASFAFSPDHQCLRIFCRLILYRQMVLLSCSFNIENYMSKIINNDDMS